MFMCLSRDGAQGAETSALGTRSCNLIHIVSRLRCDIIADDRIGKV